MLWRALARRFPVLAIRDFRLLLADRLLAPAAFAFSLVGVSFAVLDISGSTADLSYVLAAQIAPSLVFTLISGVIADRIPPQRVIVAANIMIAVGEGTLGILVLTGQAVLWQMIVLETLTGVGMAVFWPASQALLPKIVPDPLLQQANALSRLAMNGAQMGGAAVAGLVVAAVGPGWALTVCGVGLLSTIPMLLAIRVTGHERVREAGMLGELRDGWSEFVSHTWLWAIVAQFCVIMMAWYGGFQVLGPAVAKAHLGGPAAWGAIAAAEALGLIVGGVLSLRFTPRRPMLFVVCIGAAMSISPLSLAMHWPLPALCLAAVFLGVTMEIMMVQWSVALARNVPPDKLARVSAYDALGSVMAMPLGALVAGPIAAKIGLSATQYGAAVLMVAVSALALMSREVRTMRSPGIAGATGEPSMPAASSPQ
ncbi:MFS transporter [Sphaerisporangium sp. NPDC049002]|uniref:MFS transporter n=1 Tax=unclassified Sphaerisporangium TaxID=2630420 RepID=UPI0033E9F853